MAEIGGLIIARATQRVEFAAQNIANITTTGYKTRRPFLDLVQTGALSLVKGAQPDAQPGANVDFSVGKLRATENPLDLAIAGQGFFTVRRDDEILYTRAGQFSRDEQGRLATADGAILLSHNGDVRIDAGEFTVLADGTITQAGQPVSQLAIADFDNLSLLSSAGAGQFAAPRGVARDATGAQVRQGMLETSNVSTADEMISLMAAMRAAESGQHMVKVYDDLMGRVLTSFGQR